MSRLFFVRGCTHFLACIAITASAWPADYAVTVLDSAEGFWDFGSSMGLSESGIVAGSYRLAQGVTRGFINDHGVITYIDNPLVGGDFGVLGVNDAGQVLIQSGATGWAEVLQGQVETEIRVGTLHSTLACRAINQAGVVVGTAYNQRGFRWLNGSSQYIGNGPGYLQPNAVNELEQYAGAASLAGAYGPFKPGIVINGTRTILPSGDNADAWGMNNIGTVVGNDESKFAYWKGGQLFHENLLSGMDYGHFQDVNDSDVMVGFGNNYRGCVYRRGHGLQYLDDLLDPVGGWSILPAFAVNNAGQIAAWGRRDGQFRPVLLSPVPEPSSLLVLGATLGCLLGTQRRRAR